jgi:hypothetical protein
MAKGSWLRSFDEKLSSQRSMTTEGNVITAEQAVK